MAKSSLQHADRLQDRRSPPQSRQSPLRPAGSHFLAGNTCRQASPRPACQHAPEITAAAATPEEVEEEEATPLIVRRKTFTLTPMDEQEALEQLQLLGHEDFFVFYNAETSKINVLYRRRDGTYGLIDPVVG